MTAKEIATDVLGLALVIGGGVAIYREPQVVDPATVAVHLLHYKVAAGVIGAGLLLVVPSRLAAGVKEVGTAAADVWRARQQEKTAGE